jgi:nicotinamide mononucleotide adenylyltransferase
MRTVVIYPGRFHPFHRGHKASYDYLTRQYGADNVFVVSSDKQDPETSPFSFADKMDMMTKLGISPGRIAQVKNPYQAQEIKNEIDDPENTVLIFAVSEKDMAGDSARFTFGSKKDGTPSYMQPLPADGKNMQNMTQHAYVAVTPTVNFKVRGADANSASQIRKQYVAGNDADRDQIIADLYGDVDSGIRDIFDKKLGTGRPVQTVAENHTRIVQKINHLKEMIAQLKESEPEDYIEEKWSQKYKSSINCSNPKGFSQKAHCAGRKKKVNESSGPSLQGSFTPDLTRSKVWLLKELANIVPTVDTVYILGSWYGNLALYMHLQPTVEYNKIINVEIDSERLNQSQRMLDHVGADRVSYMLKDANKLDYQQLGPPTGVVINTSLTNMADDQWFERIPTGTLVVMQARDQDPGEQYHSPQDIVDRFPMSQVYYTGTLELQDPETAYQRFMVIGRK